MSKKFGLSAENLKFINDQLELKLAHKNMYQIDVFGSRAQGREKKYSDLDLWIEAAPEVSNTELEALRLIFDESELPIKIDLVTPQTVLDEYRDSIAMTKQPWIRKNISAS